MLIKQEEATQHMRRGQKTIYSHREEPLDLRDRDNSGEVKVGARKSMYVQQMQDLAIEREKHVRKRKS